MGFVLSGIVGISFLWSVDPMLANRKTTTTTQRDPSIGSRVEELLEQKGKAEWRALAGFAPEMSEVRVHYGEKSWCFKEREALSQPFR